jgi:hypothetical protein
MRINLNEDSILTILTILKDSYMNHKRYFKEYPDEVDGIITPSEIANIYNYILDQEEGYKLLGILKPIKFE